MIVFDLECRTGDHRFEGWFSSSDDYASQRESGLVACPECGSQDVVKALMAPNLGRKGNQVVVAPSPPAPPQGAMSAPVSPAALQVMRTLAAMQADAVRDSRWVGESFADDARAMHYGERDIERIHGQATVAEARELLEEGIQVAPLPFPVVPPDQAN